MSSLHVSTDFLPFANGNGNTMALYIAFKGQSRFRIEYRWQQSLSLTQNKRKTLGRPGQHLGDPLRPVLETHCVTSELELVLKVVRDVYDYGLAVVTRR
jgi:hypothetical protein